MPRERRDLRLMGWTSSPARLGMLAFGWTLFALAVTSGAVGWLTGRVTLQALGALAGIAVWLVAGLVPDPLPAPRRDVRRRMRQLEPIQGHQLPDMATRRA